MNANTMEYNSVSCREDKWYCCIYETGFNNRVGTGVGNVSAFKRQLLYNRIGKVSVFVFFIDISIISNTKKNDTSLSYNNATCLHDRRHYYIPRHSHSVTRKHDTISLQTIMNNIFLKNFFLKLSRVVRARQWMMRGGVK
jgi:hypothetical protein